MNKQRVFRIGMVFTIGLSVVAHLLSLTKLPIFSDEAIYLRWAQLIISEPFRYLFFSLNDGKTPLFIWQLVGALSFPGNPLWLGRITSVMGGMVLALILVRIAKLLGLGRAGQLTAATLVSWLPFWYFHHQMALMDGWLVVWIAAAWWGTISLIRQLETTEKPPLALSVTANVIHELKLPAILVRVVLTSVCIWAALMTKLPAVLALLALVITPLFVVPKWSLSSRKDVVSVVVSWVAIGGGLLLFGLFAVVPGFPALFTRGNDFLLPLPAFIEGGWQGTVPSLPTYLGYFVTYLGASTLLLALIGLLSSRWRRLTLGLWISAMLFFIPIWFLGKMVYPRYLLPSALWVTMAAAIGVQELWRWSTQVHIPLKKRRASRLLLLLIICSLGLTTTPFIGWSMVNPDNLPFVDSDRGQYLTKWSSGQGILPVYSLMQQWSINHPQQQLVVATEGRFGTLPDGLLVYNFRHPLPNVWIEGTEEVPVGHLRGKLLERAQQADEIWLVVNSDRVSLPAGTGSLLSEFCRPAGTTCLQLWRLP